MRLLPVNTTYMWLRLVTSRNSNEAGMQDKTEFQNKEFRYVL